MVTLNYLRKSKAVNHHQKVSFQILEKLYTFKDGVESNDILSQTDMLSNMQEWGGYESKDLNNANELEAVCGINPCEKEIMSLELF